MSHIDDLAIIGRDSLPLTCLPGPRQARWAYLGTQRPDQAERLDKVALASLLALGLALIDRRDDDSLPVELAAAAGVAVRRCGGKWPAPDRDGPRPQRAADGLDVPCWWGIKALWLQLGHVYFRADDRNLALCRAFDAAGDLHAVLAHWIGPPVVAETVPTPSAQDHARAWRRFETAMAGYAPLPLLPVLVRAPRPPWTGQPALRLIDPADAGAGQGPHAA